ncbi:phosphotransferase [Deinococcus apachensis]|uniref:phosphotransferase n=1 Tax=Deinococcus apachensis TaxID=309886 RepID=UPI000378AE69|nr:phosphotransferase [Deinococcus apachensis]
MRPQEIAGAWAVGEVRAVWPLSGGSINGAFRMVTGAGEFHLRVYRSPGRARVEREHAAIGVAVRAGVPTPAPLPPHTERIEAAILALPSPDEVDGWALTRTRQRLAYLHACPLTGHSPAFPRRFLHGDYHEGNVFFRGLRPAALIDWEQTRLAPRAWETAQPFTRSRRSATSGRTRACTWTAIPARAGSSARHPTYRFKSGGRRAACGDGQLLRAKRSKRSASGRPSSHGDG